jgi:hypothetical protein
VEVIRDRADARWGKRQTLERFLCGDAQVPFLDEMLDIRGTTQHMINAQQHVHKHDKLETQSAVALCGAAAGAAMFVFFVR